MAAQPMEIRMAHLEGAYEQINHRLGRLESELTTFRGSMESQFAELRRSMESRFAGVESRFAGMDSRLTDLRKTQDRNFYWVIGLILVSIIFPQVQHYGAR